MDPKASVLPTTPQRLTKCDRNVECIRGKSGVDLEMWSVFPEVVAPVCQHSAPHLHH